jgi:predicted ATPase/signal transduction histidine kinase
MPLVLNQAPRRLFGRVAEMAALRECYARVQSGGQSEVVLVSGAAGIGKSALVHRLDALLGNDPHGFASGKCDMLQRDVPFAPMVQVLRTLIDGALVGSDAQLNDTCARLRDDIGREARAIVDIVPEAQVLVGRGITLPELPPMLAQARNNRVLVSVVSAFATARSPLIIFLDDIQWADSSSLAFLVALVSARPKHLLLVMAVREEEMAPLLDDGSFLAEIRQTGVPIFELPLHALALEDTADLLTATLGEVHDPLMLAEIVHRQTEGNPFFVQQVLKTLQEERSLASPAAGAELWDWHPNKEHRSQQIGNVLDFMAVRVGRLSEEEREFLGALALLGNHSEAATLATITGREIADANAAMHRLARSGFILETAGRYAFAHDHIRKTSILLTPAEERPSKHALIARLLMVDGQPPSPEHAFKVAGQIVQALVPGGAGATVDPSIVPLEDRARFAAALNQAAAHAKKAAAAEQVATYVDCAMSLASLDWWDEDYQLIFSLEFARCEQMLLRGEIDDAGDAIATLLTRAANDIDRAVCYRLEAGLRTVQSDYDGAIEAALEGLSLLGYRLSRYPSSEECRAACSRVEALVGGQATRKFLELELADDTKTGLITSLLSGLFAAIFSEDGLRFIHTAAIVELTLQHGVTADAAHGLAWYGVMIADMYGRYEDGFGYTQAALALVDRHGFEAQRTDVLIAVDQLSPWIKPLSYALARVRDAIAAGDAAGDLGMTCYARNHLVSDLILSGEQLSLIEDEADRGLELTRRIDFRDIELLISAQRAFVRRLSVGERSFAFEDHGDISSASTRFWVRLYDGASAYMFDEFDRAASVLEEAGRLTWAVPANIDLVYFELFSALSAARTLTPSAALAAMVPHRERLARWATLNPGTFANKLSLVEAEEARLRGDHLSALRMFDLSIEQSSDLVHERALARELAGRLAFDIGLGSAARGYLQDSCADYLQWGANEKADLIREGFASAFLQTGAQRTSKSDGSVLASSVALAREFTGELHLAPLIEKVMRSVISEASADSGLLILLHRGDPVIEASGRMVDGAVEITIATALPTPDRVAPRVLSRALETKMPIVMSENELGTSRPHGIAEHAMLCFPLMNGGLRVGALLLRRTGGSRGFAANVVSRLETLAAQAGISLCSARMYTDVADALEGHSEAAASLRLARSELARTSHLSVMGGLAASIAHEINQPLASILAYSAAGRRWLRRKEPDLEEALACIDSIHGAGVRASEIVQSLRSLAKQESPALSPVSPNVLVREVIKLLAPEIEALSIQVACVFETDDGTMVAADRVQLQQVAHNLLTNAIDAVTQNPVSDRRVDVRVFGQGDGVVVRVQDNGCGIPPEKMKEVLTPLFTTKSKGMGMGLTICKSIIEAHGGALKVMDAPERGAVFEFSIPHSSIR